MASGFKKDKTPFGTDLVITGPWSRQAERQIVSGRATGLVLNYALGFQERDLEFLRPLRLQRVTILARSIRDLTPLYSSADRLTYLDLVVHERASIDLARLPLLRQLSADWQQVAASIQHANRLQSLYLGSFLEDDLQGLSSLSSLTRLRMKERPQLASLDGLEALPWLEELAISGASRLQDILALGRVSSPILRHLNLEANRRIPSLEPLAHCTALTFLNLGDCGDLPSASPLRDLSALEGLYLYETTQILDGDLSPIAELPRLQDFRMRNRRHYTPAVAEIMNTIAAR